MGSFFSRLFDSQANNAQNDANIGKIVQLQKERVKIIRKLAEGGFATIYLVRNASGETFALKHFASNNEDRMQFIRTELLVFTEISNKSEHLLKLIDRDANSMNLLIPFYPEGSVQSKIDRERKRRQQPPYTPIISYFPMLLAIKLTLQILRAIIPFHQYPKHPLAHRDISPYNILLRRDNNDKTNNNNNNYNNNNNNNNDFVRWNEYDGVLIDFGSATNARPSTESYNDCVAIQEYAELTSSLLYRAPELYEIMAGGLVDERSDIWSIGCVMYFFAYGISPFEFALKEGGSVKLAVVSGSYKTFDAPGYEEEYFRIMRGALSVDPSKRPTAEQLIFELEFMFQNGMM